MTIKHDHAGDYSSQTCGFTHQVEANVWGEGYLPRVAEGFGKDRVHGFGRRGVQISQTKSVPIQRYTAVFHKTLDIRVKMLEKRFETLVMDA